MSTSTRKTDKILSAGIDIGSNSLRMLIAETESGKIKSILRSERTTTRLASGIAKTGKLSEEAFLKSVEVLKRYKKILTENGVSKVGAFATSAVREAKNGPEFIEAAKNLGIDVTVITGVKEAELVYTGVKSGMDVGPSPVIFDVGGGSTEFVSVENEKIIFAESYKIGVVKLSDMFDMMDGAADSREPCEKFVSDYFKNLTLPEKAERLIATAGTATTVAAADMGLEKYDWEKVNGYAVTRTSAEKLLKTLCAASYAERSLIPGIEKGREDLIIPGIIIMLEIMKKTGFDAVTVSDFGLREGAAVAASLL